MKAVKKDYPQTYWVAIPCHMNFKNNPQRSVFMKCMESIFKNRENHRIIRMKEHWNYEKDDLVNDKGRLTSVGKDTYWQSIDAALKYNVLKREEFLSRCGWSKNKPPSKRPNTQDPVGQFFKREKE